MKDWRNKKISIGTVFVISVSFLIGGMFLGQYSGDIWRTAQVYLGIKKQVSPVDWDRSLAEVYYELQDNFDGDLDINELVEGAKRGLVDAAGNKYTVYMDSTEATEWNASMSGDVGAGIGVEIALRDGYVKVIRTLADNPARRAGILAGDIIYMVDGENVLEKTSDEVANRLRGQAGTEVKVVVIRDQTEEAFTLRREKINNESVYLEYKDDTPILVISRFDQNSDDLAEKYAKELAGKGYKKLILDLRNNGGGYVDATVDIAALWLDGDLIMEQKSTKSYNNEKYYAKRNKAVLKDFETIVLINNSSASASEILAGALATKDNVTLLGEQTFGKGSVQVLKNLTGGAKLKVTIAHWYTPTGQCIDGEGITPDIEIERTFDDINHNRDPQLDKALELL